MTKAQAEHARKIQENVYQLSAMVAENGLAVWYAGQGHDSLDVMSAVIEKAEDMIQPDEYYEEHDWYDDLDKAYSELGTDIHKAVEDAQ